jgi:hypothetical protein
MNRLSQQIKTLPRILAAVLDEDLHERAAGGVDHPKAGAVENVGDREGHSRLHPHPPQALLAVAQRRVEQLNVRHAQSVSARS